ncbi:E3 SUMO-protein ligase NSE2 domain-containing protein [Phanerochaete sordida]|uniref:E3 SUMO-protein ligase NSE2 domain-containing protein n=1 Tax=Phanerochaete sordida TaxID=48140 RepID=A0A9P3LL45_9APHY|nr:E3 SUMO-protein ligase NSE2 domain-containing protein [Phanerochaete sordida]
MPVATSSRRLRRQDTDDIEDAVATQGRDEELDEVEAATQPRQAKGAKKEKKPRREPEEDDDVEDDDDQDDDPLANFTDQPVDKQQALRVQGLAQDWAQIRTGIHSSSYALVQDIGTAIAEFMEGEKVEAKLAEVDRTMRKLIDTENDIRAHEDTLKDLHQQIERGDAVAEILSRYEGGVQQRTDDYQSKTSRQKYAKHENYASFRQAVYEVQHPDEPMPPVSDFIPAEAGDDSDDEDDIQIGGVTQDYKCPLTLKLLEDPLTSDICKHSFDASAIREFLGTSRKKCPNAGCNQVISVSNLKPNKDLAKKAKEAARRERMREEEDSDDAESVIE